MIIKPRLVLGCTQTTEQASTTTPTTTSDPPAEPYTFTLPPRFYIMENSDVSDGDEVQFDGSCNPDYTDLWDRGCTFYSDRNLCEIWDVYPFVNFASINEAGFYETALNCPQCGCESNVGVNLNDVYAAELTGR